MGLRREGGGGRGGCFEGRGAACCSLVQFWVKSVSLTLSLVTVHLFGIFW